MRYSTRVVVFLLFLNAAAGAFVASGAAGDWGISPTPGGDEVIEQANESATSIQGDGGFAQTLFGAFAGAANAFESIFAVVFAGPLMLSNLGVPGWLVGFVFAPAYLLVGIDLVYILTQRRA
jgi:hypothetical protein